jgi:outer membrane protein assembly factor BamB
MLKLNKSSLNTLLILSALVLLSILILPGSVLADDNEWAQFHKDIINNGYSSSEAPDSCNLIWETLDIGAASSSSVVVANNKVFVNTGSSITCLDITSGNTLWSEPVNPSTVWGSWSSPAYHDGRVFIATDNITCFSENGGPAIWTYALPQAAGNGSVTVADGKVVTGDWGGGKYHCVSEADGHFLWEFDCVEVPGTTVYAQGTPAYQDGKFYLTSWNYPKGHVYCVDATSGGEIWHSDGVTDGTYQYDACGSVCLAEGKVFFTTYNFYGYGELVALNAATGNLEWGPIQIERTDSTPSYHDGKLYLCGGCVNYSDEGERTYCFNAANGNLVWRTEVTDGVGNWTCSPAVADGKVFAGKPSATEYFDYEGIYALDISTGNILWSYEHGGASPAVAGGYVFTIGEGKVFAFSAPAYPDWDVNQDGFINMGDIVRVGLHWGETGASGWIPEDVNNDGMINMGDIVVIGIHWGE